MILRNFISSPYRIAAEAEKQPDKDDLQKSR